MCSQTLSKALRIKDCLHPPHTHTHWVGKVLVGHSCCTGIWSSAGPDCNTLSTQSPGCSPMHVQWYWCCAGLSCYNRAELACAMVTMCGGPALVLGVFMLVAPALLAAALSYAGTAAGRPSSGAQNCMALSAWGLSGQPVTMAHCWHHTHISITAASSTGAAWSNAAQACNAATDIDIRLADVAAGGGSASF